MTNETSGAGRSGQGTDRGAGPSDEQTPWYERWFGEEYLRLYPHRDRAEARQAVALLLDRVCLQPGDRVLDLACGAGRHLEAIRLEGIAAFGLDLSRPLLRRAHALADAPPVAQGDMRELPFADGAFAAVGSFFTSFGYFESEAQDRRVVREIGRVLRADGHLLLDFLNAERVIEGLRPRDERRVGGRRVVQERRIVGQGRAVEKRIRIGPGPDGAPPREYRERVRLYRPAELDELLAAEGLLPEARLGDYAGGAWSPSSPRLIIVARRPR